MPRKITNEDIFSAVEKMELADFLKLINHYSETADANFEKEKIFLVQKDLQKHLETHNINKCCPYCGSSIITTHGYRNGMNHRK